MRFSLAISLVLLGYVLQAQDTVYTYLDSNWKKCKQEEATYYRKAYRSENRTWIVADYFLDGQLQMSGVYKEKKLKTRDGKFIRYYENGNKESEGHYSDDKREGEWIFWYENGYVDRKGAYAEGKMAGDWSWYFLNGNISASESYENGVRIHAEFFDEDGNWVSPDDAEYYPTFNGGMEALYATLNYYMVYPPDAKMKGISGVVNVEFTVDTNGSIQEPKVTNIVHSSLAEEALRIVQQLPDFIPGKMHNRPARVVYKLPIRFTLRQSGQ